MSSSAPARNTPTGALSWLGTGAIAALLWPVVWLVPPWLIHPDAVPPSAAAFLGNYAAVCSPEPIEQLRYLLAIVLAPLAFVLLHGVLTRRAAAPASADTASPAWIAAACTVQAALCGVGLLHWSAMKTAEGPYFDPLAMLAMLPVLLIVLGFASFVVARNSELGPTRIPVPAGGFAMVIAGVFVLSQLLASVFTEANYVLAPRPTAYHLPYPLGELAGVLNGRTPLVDFFPQYQNLLSYVLRPWCAWFGIGVGSCTTGMVLLGLCSFAGVFAVLQVCSGTAWRALALFVPYVLLSLDAQDAGPFRRVSTFSYYAVGPLRYVGPFVLAGMCVWAARRPNRTRSVALALAAALVALNNLDFGVPACVASCVALLMAESDPRWLSATRVARRVGLFGVSFVAVVVGYSLVARGLSGEWPAWSVLASYQRIFAISGFMMLPMPSTGLHFVVYATFMAAIFRGYALRAEQCTANDTDRRRIRVLAAMLVWSGVFGSGAAMYYVGRSHVSVLPCLFPAWGLSVMLLIVDLFGCWLAARREQVLSGTRGVLLAVPTLALSFLLLAALSTATRASNPFTELERLKLEPPFMLRFDATLRAFVRANAAPGEHVMIASPFGHAIAQDLGLDNVYPFASSGSLIVRAQLDLVLAQLAKRHVTKVFGTLHPDLQAALRLRGFRLASVAALDLPSTVIATQLTDTPDPQFAFWLGPTPK